MDSTPDDTAATSSSSKKMTLQAVGSLDKIKFLVIDEKEDKIGNLNYIVPVSVFNDGGCIRGEEVLDFLSWSAEGDFFTVGSRRGHSELC